MLQSIHVKNLALIADSEVEFAEGLNIITGETGAGKSLLIGSVNLALGGKFDASMLRQGAESGFVELVFYCKEKTVSDKLAEMDITPEEDGSIIITRKFSQGKSSCRVNGESVTLKALQELSAELIDIHGQHDHRNLQKRSKHLEIIDSYGAEELAGKATQTGALYHEYKELQSEYSENKKDTETILREKSLLEFEVKEIEDADIKNGEDEELEQLYVRISNSRKIAESLSEAYNLTSDGEGDAASRIGQALRSISSVSGYDKRLESLEGQITDIESLLNDFNRELSGYLNDYDFEEGEFERVERRLNLINDLKNKYGGSIDRIREYAASAQEKLEKYENYEEYISSLEKKIEAKKNELEKCCAELSDKRKKVAVKLSEQLKASLEGLNFPQVQIEIRIERSENITSKGFDEADFLISTNIGEPVKPLENVASGGELSRIMLGIKTVMAARDNTGTLIFDEIDAGISGRTAWKVSEQLGLLSRKHQVLCITHLPQIAAMADEHFVIEKSASLGSTTTDVRGLDYEESIGELARLLGSDEESKAAVDNARDMKLRADEYKKTH